MPALEHGPPPESSKEAASPRNARYGLILFAIYLIIYGAFVLLNAFWPTVMDAIPFAGLNLAILYGFGLIGTALILAGIYAWLCRLPEERP